MSVIRGDGEETGDQHATEGENSGKERNDERTNLENEEQTKE